MLILAASRLFRGEAFDDCEKKGTFVRMIGVRVEVGTVNWNGQMREEIITMGMNENTENAMSSNRYRGFYKAPPIILNAIWLIK